MIKSNHTSETRQWPTWRVVCPLGPKNVCNNHLHLFNSPSEIYFISSPYQVCLLLLYQKVRITERGGFHPLITPRMATVNKSEQDWSQEPQAPSGSLTKPFSAAFPRPSALRWDSLNTNWHPYGMLASQVIALPIRSRCQPYQVHILPLSKSIFPNTLSFLPHLWL